MKYGLIAFSAFAVTALVGGCATQRADGQAKRPMSSTIGTKTSVNEAGEEIICKRDYATGSRVKYNEICGTAAEWAEIEQRNRESMRHMTESAAANSN
tara:strand:- start:8348 stop:8641 length:294 start_codon:yes stop_codon:yes gene_type:complete